jgi:hypothetical protein
VIEERRGEVSAGRNYRAFKDISKPDTEEFGWMLLVTVGTDFKKSL